MGQKEEKMKSPGGFLKLTIFRPGMLNRGVTDRFMEKMLSNFGIDVTLLARAMVNDAESAMPTAKEEPLIISGNGKITKLANL